MMRFQGTELMFEVEKNSQTGFNSIAAKETLVQQ